MDPKWFIIAPIIVDAAAEIMIHSYWQVVWLAKVQHFHLSLGVGMKMSRWTLLVTASLIVPMHASGQTSTTYQYDVFGRLVSAVVTGSPASSANTALINYDAAGNRTAVRSGSSATPTPTPTPTPSAAAPVAKNPTLSFYKSTTNSIAIDTLATTSTAARITAFSPPSGGGSAAIAGDGQSVNYTSPDVGTPGMCEPADVVTVSVSYTVQNTSGGASASGTATIKVRGAAGPRPSRGQQCP